MFCKKAKAAPVVVSRSRAHAHRNLVTRGEAVIAERGMLVRAREESMVAWASGRVCEGVGVVERVDNDLGNLRVGWECGERTVWTRAGAGGEFDLVRA